MCMFSIVILVKWLEVWAVPDLSLVLTRFCCEEIHKAMVARCYAHYPTDSACIVVHMFRCIDF